VGKMGVNEQTFHNSEMTS